MWSHLAPWDRSRGAGPGVDGCPPRTGRTQRTRGQGGVVDVEEEDAIEMRRMEGSPQGRVHCPKWSHHSSHNRRNLCNMRSQSDLFKQCTKISYLMMETLCFAHIQKSCYSGFLFVWMCSVWFCLLCWLKFLIVWRRPASPSRREGSGAVFTDKSPSPSTVWLTERSPNPFWLSTS